MQYILTKQELDDLVPRRKYEEKCNEAKELQRLLMKATKHKCIYDRTKEDEEEDGYDLYCDSCPLQNFDCGRRKDFSQ